MFWASMLETRPGGRNITPSHVDRPRITPPAPKALSDSHPDAMLFASQLIVASHGEPNAV
jgi:hypothetical protein